MRSVVCLTSYKFLSSIFVSKAKYIVMFSNINQVVEKAEHHDDKPVKIPLLVVKAIKKKKIQ